MKISRSNRQVLFWFLFIILSYVLQELTLSFFIGGIRLWFLVFGLITTSLILGVLGFLKKPWRHWLMEAYLIGTGLIFASEFLYYRFFKTLFGFHMLSMAGQLGQFFGDALKLVIVNLPFLLVFFLPWALYHFRLGGYFKGMKVNPSLSLALLVIGGLILGLNHLSLAIRPQKMASPQEYYFYDYSQLETAKTFGLMGSMNIKLGHQIFGFRSPDFVLEEDQDLTTIFPGRTSLASLDGTLVGKHIIRPQVLDLDFRGLAATRDSDTIKQMDLYYASVEPSLTNYYTGMFEGYNLIFITAESFWTPVVDPERTPTLYKMITEGIYMKDFYNPLWRASTSDGEYTGLTGMIPKDGVWSLLAASQNYSPQLPGWRLREAGYNTFAYHNHDYDYYERDISHPQIGYDYKGLGSGVEVTVQWPESDLEMMEVTMDEFLDQEPFHVYYLSVSGHSGYSYSGNAMAYKNKDRVENLELSEEAASYLAANLELEDALSYLMKKLNEKGIAERTIIALNPDHYPYALSDGAVEELVGQVDSIKDLLSSSAIIYVQGMEPIVVDKPVSSLDILPSLYNLLGIDFDSRLLSGRDIFSEEALVRFVDRSWITDKGFYNSSTDEFTAFEPVEDDYVEKMHDRIRLEFYFSNLLLDEDYYSYLPRKAFEME
ncbi:MAG: sulfatase-like hydrolase/transferase [Tissierellia bacterium]|nr:sulfatase-like hydrolase/transferase [Tissierellia bacterium]